MTDKCLDQRVLEDPHSCQVSSSEDGESSALSMSRNTGTTWLSAFLSPKSQEREDERISEKSEKSGYHTHTHTHRDMLHTVLRSNI